MTLERVDPVPVSEQVYRQLLDAILSGEIRDKLPSERDLAVTFTVNRHAVREAMKRLQQANLVEINQGGATRVLSVRESGRLDLMPDMLVHGGQIDFEVVRSILEMRVCIGGDAARRCAERSPESGAELRRLAGLCENADDEQLIALNRKYWTHLVDGADNIAYRLSLNTLIAGIDAVTNTVGGEAFIALLVTEYRRTAEMLELADAIHDSNADKAAMIATSLLSPVSLAP
ncbi:FadR/GntR family transcriptional regulator [Smaragdicoccus niigatensis]|uniref:FadR/GntR family transcriptional regulator n=1 Tax=Smaragdicoccus niigatensis TaxID=359359 RepID=UPI00036636B9|nr:GntR family transcriptional regulator [Smaragdicoccus niigatensis]